MVERTQLENDAYLALRAFHVRTEDEARAILALWRHRDSLTAAQVDRVIDGAVAAELASEAFHRLLAPSGSDQTATGVDPSAPIESTPAAAPPAVLPASDFDQAPATAVSPRRGQCPDDDLI